MAQGGARSDRRTTKWSMEQVMHGCGLLSGGSDRSSSLGVDVAERELLPRARLGVLVERGERCGHDAVVLPLENIENVNDSVAVETLLTLLALDEPQLDCRVTERSCAKRVVAYAGIVVRHLASLPQSSWARTSPSCFWKRAYLMSVQLCLF